MRLRSSSARVCVANVIIVVVPPAIALLEPVSKLSAHSPPRPWGPVGRLDESAC